MNVALRQVMTLEQFLAWEDRQELRHEFDGSRPMAMTGGTAAHASIRRNIIVALANRMRGQLCQVFGSDLKILVDGHIRYPDAFIVCRPVASGDKVVTDPVVVFEVLSPSTTRTDLVVKNAEYRATASIQRYVVLMQTGAGATVFCRKGEEWVTEILTGPEAMLQLPEVAIEVPLAEFFANVAFEPDVEEA